MKVLRAVSIVLLYAYATHTGRTDYIWYYVLVWCCPEPKLSYIYCTTAVPQLHRLLSWSSSSWFVTAEPSCVYVGVVVPFILGITPSPFGYCCIRRRSNRGHTARGRHHDFFFVSALFHLGFGALLFVVVGCYSSRKGTAMSHPIWFPRGFFQSNGILLLYSFVHCCSLRVVCIQQTKHQVPSNVHFVCIYRINRFLLSVMLSCT